MQVRNGDHFRVPAGVVLFLISQPRPLTSRHRGHVAFAAREPSLGTHGAPSYRGLARIYRRRQAAHCCGLDNVHVGAGT